MHQADTTVRRIADTPHRRHCRVHCDVIVLVDLIRANPRVDERNPDLMLLNFLNHVVHELVMHLYAVPSLACKHNLHVTACV